MIIQLTPENFDQEVLQSKGLTFVKFSCKTGCRFCTDFKPKYEACASTEKEKFCEYERESMQTPSDEIEKKYQIQSFPTILVFEDGILQGTMPKYKFYSNRDLQGLILDEQKSLFQKQCYVEDLMNEVQMRNKKTTTQEEPDFLPNVPPAPHEEWCTSCQ